MRWINTARGAVVGVLGLLAVSAASGAGPVFFEKFTRTPSAISESENKPAPNPARSPNSLVATGNSILPATTWPSEIEPNDSPAAATPVTLVNGGAVVQGSIFPNGDVDYYSFPGTAGQRVYAAVITSFSSSASTDSQLRLFGTDGTTLIEFDEDDGSLGGLASSIAGATLTATGTHYLQVKHFSATNTLRPYRLYLQVRSGSPTPEVESNDTAATANPLPAGGGWVSGKRDPAVATEQDWFSIALNAGDTVFLGLDLDPERDNVQWNGRLGFALFGDAGNQILVVDDASAGSVANPLSEVMVFTVKNAGTYYAYVDSATAATGGPTATYHLNVSVFPRPVPAGVCTTYTSTDVPKTLGPSAGLTSSTITVPGNPRVGQLRVGIQLNHALMADLDVNLRSPAGQNNGLFSDIGATATGGQTIMDVVWDDDAALPPVFTVLNAMHLQPELNYRLDWFQGIDGGGIWTLDLRDDLTNASGGTLTGWNIQICEPPPPPVCAPGYAPVVVYTTDFESGVAGWTHTGTGDQWALGTPATLATTTTNPVAAITSCASGANCWKTNLTGTYNISTTHDLLSPTINLAGFSPPVVVRWAHNYQMESATFDHYSVDFQKVGGTDPVRLFDWQGATMTAGVGSPIENIGENAGWGRMAARADSLAGFNTQLKFHVDTDSSINFAGVAVDDVSVTACRRSNLVPVRSLLLN